jgi:hypothetical protein
MFYEAPVLKTMTQAQIAYLTGKRVDSNKWIIPDWHAKCAVTGKMYPEDAFAISFPHHAFTREQLNDLGGWGVGWVEDADWLSEEGYDILMARVDALGYRHFIDEYYWGPVEAPQTEEAEINTPTLTAEQTATLSEAAQGFGQEIAAGNVVTQDLILGAYSDFIFFFDADIELDVLKAHEDFIVEQIAIGTRL